MPSSRYPAAVTTDERSNSAAADATPRAAAAATTRAAAPAATAATRATPAARPRLVIALDGPASSGKSTVGAEAARRLRYRFCDTGLLYRAVTWLALERGVAPGQTEALVPLADEVELVADGRGRLCQVRVGERDVTAQVHRPAVDRAVSDYSKVAQLRSALVPRQRAIAAAGGIIMAGRDIGTVILPGADVKIYLSASAEERARRRATQRKLSPDGAAAATILEDLRRRDAIDTGRATAPLRTAADSVVILTDGNAFNDTVAAVIRAIHEAEAKRPADVAATRNEGSVDGP
jgi:cytidylate kinase